MKPLPINNHSIRRGIGLVAVSGFLLVRSSFAGGSGIEGTVKDNNGRPVGGANIRIEARNNTGWSRLVQSDARGHYIYNGLTPGTTYRVTLLIKGAAKASINNVLAKGEATQLNFELKTSSVSGSRTVTKNGKRYVFIPEETGTHLGGRWVEVDENGQADSVGVNNVERAGAEALRRMQSNSGAVGGMGAGGH